MPEPLTPEEESEIRARLESGNVVVLEKDCECIIHEGPHWLHMDDVDKRLNARLRDGALNGEVMAFKAYSEAELRRLGEKRRNMERGHIAEIIREKSDDTRRTAARHCAGGGRRSQGSRNLCG